EVAPYALFYRMLDATFLSLNQSNPNITERCWLCYTKPPFYEGIAINASLMYSNEPNPVACKWNASRTGITLAHITGQSTCVG
ncbi:ENV1 protein, partial [Zosterops hypoxanthus]|nr:ENV1 protein [Zosterops hypoxanthus]